MKISPVLLSSQHGGDRIRFIIRFFLLRRFFGVEHDDEDRADYAEDCSAD